jgi:hypothetical protein
MAQTLLPPSSVPLGPFHPSRLLSPKDDDSPLLTVTKVHDFLIIYATYLYLKLYFIKKNYRKTLFWRHFDHAAQQILALGRNKMGNVEDTALHLRLKLYIEYY